MVVNTSFEWIFFSISRRDFREGYANVFASALYALPLCLYNDKAKTLSSIVNRRPRGF